MIPATILAQLGIPLADLIATASLRNVLVSALDLAVQQSGLQTSAVYFRFVANAAAAKIPRSQAMRLFSEAKAWYSLPRLLGEFPTDEPLDPQLARPVEGIGPYPEEVGGYRTTVQVTATDPLTGDTIERNVYIPTFWYPTPEEMISYAEQQWEALLNTDSKMKIQKDLSGWETSFVVTDWARFV
jgi:hypothetical protein